MHWDSPSYLLLLWLLPIVVGILVYAYRKRLKAAQTFVDEAMVDRLMPSNRRFAHVGQGDFDRSRIHVPDRGGRSTPVLEPTSRRCRVAGPT